MAFLDVCLGAVVVLEAVLGGLVQVLDLLDQTELLLARCRLRQLSLADVAAAERAAGSVFASANREGDEVHTLPLSYGLSFVLLLRPLPHGVSTFETGSKTRT